MILAKVSIDNYKQYRGHHEFEIPGGATVGVIGANGVGKTTLFEAIEWCLYSPPAIAAKDIRPRGHGGLTKVSVVLERVDGKGQFIVERELKRSSATAVIYHVDEQSETQVVVQGSRQVSAHVATKLIGLSHVAFAATFFTRQKELHFFGDLGATDRRREVGKLLGLETIRSAQELIAVDRKQAQNEAEVLARQYEEQTSGRDFSAERAAAEALVQEREAERASVAVQVGQLAEKLVAAEASRKALQATKDQDAALGQTIAEARGALHVAVQRHEAIAAELARLDAREKERATLTPVAATLATLAAEIVALEQQRAAFNRRQEISAGLRQLHKRRRDAIDTMRSAVLNIRVVHQIDGWMWEPDDDERPVNAIARLAAAIELLDLPRVEARESALLHCGELARELTRVSEQLELWKTRRAALDEQERELLGGGDPSVEIANLETERERIQQLVAALDARRTTLEGQRDQSRMLIANLERAEFDDRCPTCARPFSENDAVLVADSLRAQIGTITAELDGIQSERNLLIQRNKFLTARRAELGAQVTALVKVQSSIQSSVTHLREQEEIVARQRAALDDALAAVGATAPPTPDTLRDANLMVVQYRSMTSTRSSLTAAQTRLLEIDSVRSQAEADLREVGEAVFDEAIHRQVVARHQEASRAQTTMEQIDHDLARRPALTEEQERVAAKVIELTLGVESIEEQRAALGFDPVALTQAIETVETTRQDERTAQQAHHAAQIALRDADQQHTMLKAEQARVTQLAEQADCRRRDADLYDRMYREFSEFERYAAGRLTPVLGDLTSELVREVTDGKYDRVEFDNNFGVQVFDGEEERFPLEGFSGGEQDAISLAARLALSRMIASQAANPPGFLVLDEVFGSLDRDRRARLLDLLGTLSGSFEDFRQLFIISHVDDVRTAAVFDEVWRIEEGSDGSSQMRVLTAGEDIGEL